MTPNRTREIRGWRWETTSLLVFLLVVGLALRWLLAPLGDFRGDAMIFTSWASQLTQSPLSDFYAVARRVDHLPGDLWLLWGTAHLYQLTSPDVGFGPSTFWLWLKIVPSLADAGIGLMLFLIARRLAGPKIGLLAAAAWLLNPASLYLTAIWGQWDSVSAFFMVAALWLLLGDSPAWSLPFLTYASLIKPQLALLFPVVVIVWWHWPSGFGNNLSSARSWFARVRGVIAPVPAAIMVFLVVDVPFNVGIPPLPTRWTIFDRLSVALNAYSSVSANAFNLWELLFGPSGRSVSDSLPLLGISAQTWGIILLAVAVVVSLVLLWRRPTPVLVLWATLAITFAMFVLPTRIHERYLLPAVVLAVLLAVIVPALRWVGAGLSLTYLVNLVYVYATAGGGFRGGGFSRGGLQPGGFRPGGFGPGGFAANGFPGNGFQPPTFQPFGHSADLIVIGVSAANVILLLVVFGIGFVLARKAAADTQSNKSVVENTVKDENLASQVGEAVGD